MTPFWTGVLIGAAAFGVLEAVFMLPEIVRLQKRIKKLEEELRKRP